MVYFLPITTGRCVFGRHVRRLCSSLFGEEEQREMDVTGQYWSTTTGRPQLDVLTRFLSSCEAPLLLSFWRGGAEGNERDRSILVDHNWSTTSGRPQLVDHNWTL